MSAREPSISRVGDEAVAARTGRTWSEWIVVLDAAGAVRMPHREIAGLLRDEHGLSPWWSQEVTVGYERARGLREKHEKPTGFEVSASKTLPVPATTAWRAWNEARWLARWLPDDPFTVRKKTRAKSMRITWADGTHVDVNLYPQGDAKCRVGVQHRKLRDPEDAAARKAFWRERLEALRESLGS